MGDHWIGPKMGGLITRGPVRRVTTEFKQYVVGDL